MNFISTKEYKKFEEFCDSCKDYRYIGLCYGIPGIGKTLSAHKYSNWLKFKSYYDNKFHDFFENPESITVSEEVLKCDTIITTISATNTPTRIESLIFGHAYALRFMKHFYKEKKVTASVPCSEKERFADVKLVIIDEADNLKYSSLEQLRNLYDRFGFGMILIGMPGIERKFSRYSQLYSRIGFLHEFKPLSKDEMTFIIEHHLSKLCTKVRADEFDDYETLNTIVRIAKGNFRVLTRLFQQLERLMKINNITKINSDLVNAAREVLVIGS